jgi:hypothetical protein
VGPLYGLCARGIENCEEVLSVRLGRASVSVAEDTARWGIGAEVSGTGFFDIEEGRSFELKCEGRADRGI